MAFSAELTTAAPEASVAFQASDTPAPSDTPVPAAVPAAGTAVPPVPDVPASNTPTTDTPVPPAPGTPAADTPAPDTPSPDTPSPDPVPSEGTALPLQEETFSPEPVLTPTPSAATPAAPVCDIPDCLHLALVEDGTQQALCPLGEWMLLQGMGRPGMMLMAATNPSVIALPNGPYTLYRSGTYELSGGGPNCVLTLNANIVVSLKCTDNTTLKALKASDHTVAEISLTGHTSIVAIERGTDTALTFMGNGSLTAGSLNDTQNITVTGGSVQLPGGFTSKNGLKAYAFPAAGTSAATVNGGAYPYTRPCPDKNAYLWLPAPSQGHSYQSLIKGGVLTVYTEEPKPTPSLDYDLSSAIPPFAPDADKAYRLYASGVPAPQTLDIVNSGVVLNLDTDLAAPGVRLKPQSPVTLYLSGANALDALEAGSLVTLSGSGSLALTDLSTNVAMGDGVTLSFLSGTVPAGLQAVPVEGGSLSISVRATFNEKPIGLLYQVGQKTTAYLPLPQPQGVSYKAVLTGTTLKVTTVPTGETSFVLGNADLRITASGTYHITSSGHVSGSILVDPKVKATLVLSGLSTSGSLTVENSATVTLLLEKSNILGKVLLGKLCNFSVEGSGALYTSAIAKSGDHNLTTSLSTTTSITLASGTTIAGTGVKPSIIHITDDSGAPMKYTQIVLKLGREKPFTTVTDSKGNICLWRRQLISGVDAVVLSQADTYATILVGGSGDPDALPTITDVKHNAYSAITYTVTGAQTSGIQYYVNPSKETMPDTYLANAGHLLMQSGECNIPGLKNGDRVVCRVFATALPGAVLSPDTVDAFQFSETYVFTASGIRVPFTLKAQSKVYDGHAFAFASKLIPGEATVTWFHNGAPLSGAPKDVGSYIAKVSIPTGHSQYLPGVTEVPVSITGYVVWIYPDFNSKIERRPEPALGYSYSEMPFGGEIEGRLTREPGEKAGNYPYSIASLTAPSCYTLKLDPDSPMFYISYRPSHFLPYDPLSRIDPVHEQVIFSDGKKLDMIHATMEKLSVSGSNYGEMITDTEDRQVRPFTPSLRLYPGYNAALLILEAEPELNRDGGYATDLDGNVQLRGRSLTLTYAHLTMLKKQRISHIALQLGDTTCFLEVQELQGEYVDTLMQENDMSRIGTRFVITLEPVSGSNLPEDALTRLPLGQGLMRVRIEAHNRGQQLDLTPALYTARLLMGAGTVLETASQTEDPDIQETVIGQRPAAQPDASAQEQAALKQAAATLSGSIEPTEALLEEARQAVESRIDELGYTLIYFGDTAFPLDSTLVVPYTASETSLALYTAIQRTQPYLMTPLVRAGLYGLGAAHP